MNLPSGGMKDRFLLCVQRCNLIGAPKWDSIILCKGKKNVYRTQGWKAQSARPLGFANDKNISGVPAETHSISRFLYKKERGICYKPESLVFVSIFPVTTLDRTTPFLAKINQTWGTPDTGSYNALVDNSPQFFYEVNINLIACVP
jgi:hypothetical protein